MIPRFNVGDVLRITFVSQKTHLDTERVGPVVHVIEPGDVPDLCWFQHESSSWVDGILTAYDGGLELRPPTACGTRRYVVRYGEGLYHVFPETMLTRTTVTRTLKYEVELVEASSTSGMENP